MAMHIVINYRPFEFVMLTQYNLWTQSKHEGRPRIANDHH